MDRPEVSFLWAAIVTIIILVVVKRVLGKTLFHEAPNVRLHEVKWGIFSNAMGGALFCLGVFLAFLTAYFSDGAKSMLVEVMLFTMGLLTLSAFAYWIWIGIKDHRTRRPLRKFESPTVVVQSGGDEIEIDIHLESRLSEKDAIRLCIRELEKKL